MNLYGIIQPEQINVLNPIGLFLLIPVFDKAIYPALEKREIDISPLRRMGWGMVLVSLAFYISGIVEYIIDYRHQNGHPPISVLWQIPQIGLMVSFGSLAYGKRRKWLVTNFVPGISVFTIKTVAEIFISVTGLEFAYSVSPDRLKSFVMAAYLMTIAKGDFWGGVLYSTVFRDLNQAVVLHIFSMLMIFNLMFYGYVVRSWELRHGLVSWDLFDRVLETESKQRPCWMSHQRQFLNMPVGGKNQYPAKDANNDVAVEKSEKSERRGRGRWRRRDAAAKKEKSSRKSRTQGSKKSREHGSKNRGKHSSNH
jgi:POT family